MNSCSCCWTPKFGLNVTTLECLVVFSVILSVDYWICPSGLKTAGYNWLIFCTPVPLHNLFKSQIEFINYFHIQTWRVSYECIQILAEQVISLDRYTSIQPQSELNNRPL
jgi:hypothetical protein